MNRECIRIAAVAVAIAGLLVSGAAAQSTTAPGLAMNGDELIELIDQALYLASAGMSGYGESDVRILAQSLVNVFEGSSGEHYDDTSATVVEVGIMSHPLMAFTSDWVTWFQSLSGSEATLAVEALANVNVSLKFAYDAALSLLQDDGGWFGHAYSWFLTYAALLAAKGDVDDPLLLPGIEQLAALELGMDAMEMEGSEATLVLQTAIQDAAESGFVMLEAGVYRGDPTILTQDITIYGVSPEETILEGTFWVPFIQILADEPITVRLQNLTIRGGVTALSTAFTGDASAQITLELENVHFVSNESGIVIGHPTQLTAHNCLFEENQTAIQVSPIGEGGLSTVELNACEFLKNETAVSARGGDTVILRYCRILDGTDPYADISIADGAMLRMSDCVLERVAGGGIRIAGSAFATLTNNTITTPYAYGIAVGPSSDDDQDCGRGFASDDEDLPPGEVTGHGNVIAYGICPFSLDFLIDPAPQEVTVSAGESIQAAVDWVAKGGTILIDEGAYQENLTIRKPVVLVAAERAVIAAQDVSRPVIDIAGTAGVTINGTRIESAASGIRVMQASCRVMSCDIESADVGLDATLFGGDQVYIEATAFAGEGVGIKAIGSGQIEVSNCHLQELATGAVIGGLMTVLVEDSAFVDMFEGVVMASGATVTLIGNTIDGARRGIRVSEAPGGPVGSLTLHSNTIRNCNDWAISLCGDTSTDDLAFVGDLDGTDNIIEGGIEALCPSWFQWPAGFLGSSDPEG